MKLGVAMPFSQHTSPARIVESAQALEASGVHSIWVPEHVVFFGAYESSYPYSDKRSHPW